MKKLSELFYTCAFSEYKEAGDDVNYLFIEEGKQLYIYFQGSNSISDWVRNFLFKKRPYKDMKIPYRVHRGFLAAWKEVEDIIIAKITEKKDDEYRWKAITVVGYSHGGALAAFCHECVWFHRPDLREGCLLGYGFEAPKIYGGFKVKKELRERWATFTVVRNKNDIVPTMPPFIFGYCHVGNYLKIGQHNKRQCIKNHYPLVVYGSLLRYEEENK